MAGHLDDKEVVKLLLDLVKTVNRIEAQLQQLLELEDRVRELELKQARNSVRWAFLYGMVGALGGIGVMMVKMMLEAVFK